MRATRPCAARSAAMPSAACEPLAPTPGRPARGRSAAAVPTGSKRGVCRFRISRGCFPGQGAKGHDRDPHESESGCQQHTPQADAGAPSVTKPLAAPNGLVLSSPRCLKAVSRPIKHVRQISASMCSAPIWRPHTLNEGELRMSASHHVMKHHATNIAAGSSQAGMGRAAAGTAHAAVCHAGWPLAVPAATAACATGSAGSAGVASAPLLDDCPAAAQHALQRVCLAAAAVAGRRPLCPAQRARSGVQVTPAGQHGKPLRVSARWASKVKQGTTLVLSMRLPLVLQPVASSKTQRAERPADPHALADARGSPHLPLPMARLKVPCSRGVMATAAMAAHGCCTTVKEWAP